MMRVAPGPRVVLVCVLLCALLFSTSTLAQKTKTVQLVGGDAWLGKDGVLQLKQLLKQRGFRLGANSSFQLRLLDERKVLLLNNGWSRRFKVPVGYKSRRLQARSIASFVEVFDEWQSSKTPRSPQKATHIAKSPHPSKKRTKTVRYRKRRTRRTAQLRKRLRRNIRRRPSWTFLLDGGVAMGIQSTFGQDMLLGGTLQPGVSWGPWIFRAEFDIRPLLFSSVVGLQAFRFGTSASYRLLDVLPSLALYAKLGLLLEWLWTSDTQRDFLLFRPGLHTGIQVRWRLTSNMYLFTGLSFLAFATHYSLERRGQAFYENSWWQFDLQCGLSIQF